MEVACLVAGAREGFVGVAADFAGGAGLVGVAGLVGGAALDDLVGVAGFAGGLAEVAADSKEFLLRLTTIELGFPGDGDLETRAPFLPPTATDLHTPPVELTTARDLDLEETSPGE